ncbi:MAG: M55 family metallopeptidase, partial [Chloroflexi bacterium]|nr:M55 family metallopeptidase [Chloroflexota bacterium]
ASEARFNASVAGQLGVPVALITGDDVICAETCTWLPHVETAVVKYAIDRYTARCLGQATAHERIRTAACTALRRLADMRPYQLSTPVRLEMVFGDSSMAAAAEIIPDVQRSGERSISYVAPDAQTAHNVCRIALELAGTVVQRQRG